MPCISIHFHVSLIHQLFSAHKSKLFLKCTETEHNPVHMYLGQFMTHCAATRRDDRLSFCRRIKQKALTTFLGTSTTLIFLLPKAGSRAWTYVLCAGIPKQHKSMHVLYSFPQAQAKILCTSPYFEADSELCRALLYCLLHCRD